MPTFALETPAKINLFLDIIGKRPDGYHNLKTIFVPLFSLTDSLELIVLSQEQLSMEIFPQILPVNDQNLCMKAARAFAEKTKLNPCWHFILKKRIPIAAGCGGGSSDAAAVLRLLNQAYDNILNNEELNTLAISLGADVPFFLNPIIAEAEGVGNILTYRLDWMLKKGGVLLVNLKFPVSAVWAYQHWQLVNIEKKETFEGLVEALEKQNIEEIKKNLFNVFDYCLLKKFPILKRMFLFIETLGCSAVHISGSGPTIFIYDEINKLKKVQKELLDRFDEKSIWLHLENFEKIGENEWDV